ncbi:ATP-binding cassette domain-containing protein [bacterium]|nr:ATP-binding cassette domain-containing protein [bacterium]
MKKEPLIEVKGFTKKFGSKIVHDGLDFDLFPNEVVGLIGGSGSGKSVFLRALIGLEHPDAGQIYYKGHDVTRLREEQWYEIRKNVAYVFQGGALFDSLTVEENLLYPLDAHSGLSRAEKQKRIDATLEGFGLGGTQQLLPSDLSGGMQKRVGLARAIILDPEIILYDEPTAGLDPFNTRNIQDVINELKSRGKGGVLVTHDIPTVYATCERLSLLMDGKIEVRGDVEKLKKGNEMVRQFIEGERYGKTK